MLLHLLILLASSLLAVESSVYEFECPRDEWGTATYEESWSCRNGESSCSAVLTSCESNGSGYEEAGTANYGADGTSSAVGGGGWDCRQNIPIYNLSS